MGVGRGGFAELATLSVERAAVMPNRIDFPEAAGLVISAGTAYEGLIDRARVQAGEMVLVTAASGGVGSAAVQIAKNAGARVIAVASARNHGYVRDLGAEMAVDYYAPDFVEQLRSAVPRGFDVLFDGTGNQVRDQVLKLVRKGGRGIFIALGAPAPPAADGVEVQSFATTVNSTRLQAVAELVSGGRLRMPIEAEFPRASARSDGARRRAAHPRPSGAADRLVTPALIGRSSGRSVRGDKHSHRRSRIKKHARWVVRPSAIPPEPFRSRFRTSNSPASHSPHSEKRSSPTPRRSAGERTTRLVRLPLGKAHRTRRLPRPRRPEAEPPPREQSDKDSLELR